MFTKRIGVLTSGGDCPGLNAVLRGVTKAADKLDWQVIGFRDGFEGLLPPSQFTVLDRATTAGIMQQGGTILGTTNKGHFVAKMGSGEKTLIPSDIVEKAKNHPGRAGHRRFDRDWWRRLPDNRITAL
jgi:ATP-dependent phosphofructokinase / diphosphate-dependent phosphofructokinase